MNIFTGMDKKIAEHIAARINHPELIDILSEQLNGSELNSILLEVFDRRLQKQTPAALLKEYAKNRLVKPAAVDVIKMKEQELRTLSLFSDLRFMPVELSPAAQLGACSVVATTDQKKILSAFRNTEVQADCTNAIALHYAYLKKTGSIGNETARFASVTRLLRMPLIKIATYAPHFSVGCLVTAGMDTGNLQFEKTALLEHLSAHHRLLTAVFQCSGIHFLLTPLNGYDKQQQLVEACAAYIRQQQPGFNLQVKDRQENQQYYKGFQVKTYITVNDAAIEVGDGGFVDWSQQLLGNRKERMFISGLGLQHLYHLTADR